MVALVLGLVAPRLSAGPEPGSVVLVHPDGTGLGMWNALRILRAGPDGMTQWDRLPRVALYRGHLTDRLGASSNGGGTVHAYGRKVAYAAFGKNGSEPLRSASGYDGSLMHEAKARGLGVGLVQSGHLAEPGTATFLARVDRRGDETEIVRQLVEAGPDVMLGGGETLFLPEGVMGRHGRPGVRRDGLDLVARARELGYRVVFTAEELDALPDRAGRVLGLFAAGHTFNDQPEEKLVAAGLPLYATNAPTVAHLTSAALRFLSSGKPPFLLVVEEEGTDNFSNYQNAAGALEAITRADEAIGVVRSFVERHPRTLMVTAADSEASGFFLVDAVPWLDAAEKEGKPAVLPTVTDRGAPFDGRQGSGGEPFLSAPDAAGRRHPFGVAWTTERDGFGAVVARAAGYRSEELPVNLDNTGLFALFRAVLWGEPAVFPQPGPR